MYWIAGISIGFLFGFLLQKGNVSQFETIVGQLLLKKFTVMKIMLTALIVGSLLIYSLFSLGLLPMLLVKQTPSFAVIVGGLILGAGMAILGLCPGTCIVASGQGSKDAWFGMAGMLTGGIVSLLFFPNLKETLSKVFYFRSLFINEYFGVSPLLFTILLGVIAVVSFYILEKKKL
jgi:uncharacterized protein